MSVKAILCVMAILMLSMLTSCGKEKVSFKTLEDARSQARENAEWNATNWRAKGHSDFDIVSRGDSSQTPECPQGDGWASIDLIAPDKTKKILLKCSTVSGNIGCLEANDFKGKPYAQEDGKCQDISKVPFPLPKIVK